MQHVAGRSLRRNGRSLSADCRRMRSGSAMQTDCEYVRVGRKPWRFRCGRLAPTRFMGMETP